MNTESGIQMYVFTHTKTRVFLHTHEEWVPPMVPAARLSFGTFFPELIFIHL